MQLFKIVITVDAVANDCDDCESLIEHLKEDLDEIYEGVVMHTTRIFYQPVREATPAEVAAAGL